MSAPTMAYNASLHSQTLTKTLWGHSTLSVCGLFLSPSKVVLFAQRPAMPVVTLAATNSDPNKCGQHGVYLLDLQ